MRDAEVEFVVLEDCEYLMAQLEAAHTADSVALTRCR